MKSLLLVNPVDRLGYIFHLVLDTPCDDSDSDLFLRHTPGPETET